MTDNLNLPPNSSSGLSRKSSELRKFIELPPEHKCEDSEQLIMRVLDGVPNPSVIQSVRNHFGMCIQCTNAFEIEIRFKLAMAQRYGESPSSFAIKDKRNSQRIDLGEIGIGDL